jgi:pimeloyl-ACP methyl ester carboxylesterase
VPALRDRKLHEQQAAAMAEAITHYQRQYPGRPAYLMGCSAGGWVALRAMELLPEGVAIDGAALFSAAVDARRDLRPALAHVRGRLVNSCSPWDVLLLGAGTLTVGTGDGRHAGSAGMLGFGPPRGENGCAEPGARAGQGTTLYDGKVVNVRWRPGMLLRGRHFGHITATAPAFVAKDIWPVLRREAQ